MRIRKYVLVSFATLGCVIAQEQNPGPQQTQPKKSGLDFTFPLFRQQKRPSPRNGATKPADKPLEIRSWDAALKRLYDPKDSLRKAVNLVRNEQDAQSEIPSPCSIPLLEAQIPKDTDFTIRQYRPRMDQLAPMPKVNPPAPSCADKK